MRILIGIVLLVVAFGVTFLMYQIHFFDAFSPIVNALRSTYNNPNGSSTVTQSPYYQQVRVQFVSLGDGAKQPMVVSLGANLKKDEGIIITGWTLWVDRTAYRIPQVTNLYSPSVPGVPPEDIYIKTGGTVNIYSGKNPQGKDQAIRSGLSEWQIWLGNDFKLPQHGTIAITDQSRLKVEEYQY